MNVSVIITNYNYSKYVRQCIQSVLDSDFDAQNMEIIIVDDASTDNSVEVIRQIQLNSNHKVTINLIENDVNLGVIRSRNLGIFHAAGAFLFMLDADNYIGKNCIHKHYECLSNQQDLTACYAPIQRFADTTGEMLFVFSNEAFDYHRLLYGNYIDAMAMFKKSHLVKIGMYDTNMPPYGWEDYELWLRLGQLNEKVALIHGPALSYYRVHGNSLLSKCPLEKNNLLVQYLKLYHPLKYELSQGNDGELVFSPRKDQFAQLFFATGENQNTTTDTTTGIINFDELHSLKVDVEDTTKTINFKFPYAQTITNLRFDPLNDYCQLRIKSIQLFLQGELLEIPFTLSSNALQVVNQVYLFVTTDAQIHINFLNNASVFIDQVTIHIDGYRMDASLIPLILEVQHLERHIVNDKIPQEQGYQCDLCPPEPEIENLVLNKDQIDRSAKSLGAAFLPERLGIENLQRWHSTIYYKDTHRDYNEGDKVARNVNSASKTLSFKLRKSKKIQSIRFDPLMDYVVVQLHGIEARLCGVPVITPLAVSSNANRTENGVYYFDTQAPYFFIDFEGGIECEMDELVVSLRYERYGLEALDMVLEEKSKAIASVNSDIVPLREKWLFVNPWQSLKAIVNTKWL